MAKSSMQINWLHKNLADPLEWAITAVMSIPYEFDFNQQVYDQLAVSMLRGDDPELAGAAIKSGQWVDDGLALVNSIH